MKDRSELSPCEFKILKNLTEGMSVKEIAQKYNVSPKTVTTHRTNIMRKLNIHCTVMLVHYALANKIATLQF